MNFFGIKLKVMVTILIPLILGICMTTMLTFITVVFVYDINLAETSEPNSKE